MARARGGARRGRGRAAHGGPRRAPRALEGGAEVPATSSAGGTVRPKKHTLLLFPGLGALFVAHEHSAHRHMARPSDEAAEGLDAAGADDGGAFTLLSGDDGGGAGGAGSSDDEQWSIPESAITFTREGWERCGVSAQALLPRRSGSSRPLASTRSPRLSC